MLTTLEFIPTAHSGIYINERRLLADGTIGVRCVGVLWV